MNIKALREKAGLTQKEIADTLETTQPAVALWESGKGMPRADKLLALAELLGCSVDDLFKK